MNTSMRNTIGSPEQSKPPLKLILAIGGFLVAPFSVLLAILLLLSFFK